MGRGSASHLRWRSSLTQDEPQVGRQSSCCKCHGDVLEVVGGYGSQCDCALEREPLEQRPIGASPDHDGYPELLGVAHVLPALLGVDGDHRDAAAAQQQREAKAHVAEAHDDDVVRARHRTAADQAGQSAADQPLHQTPCEGGGEQEGDQHAGRDNELEPIWSILDLRVGIDGDERLHRAVEGIHQVLLEHHRGSDRLEDKYDEQSDRTEEHESGTAIEWLHDRAGECANAASAHLWQRDHLDRTLVAAQPDGTAAFVDHGREIVVQAGSRQGRGDDVASEVMVQLPISSSSSRPVSGSKIVTTIGTSGSRWRTSSATRSGQASSRETTSAASAPSSSASCSSSWVGS